MITSRCLPSTPSLRLVLGGLFLLTLTVVLVTRCEAGDQAVQKGWIGDWVPARRPPASSPAPVTTPVVTSAAESDREPCQRPRGKRLACPVITEGPLPNDECNGPIDVEVITSGVKETRTVDDEKSPTIVPPPVKRFRVVAVDGTPVRRAPAAADRGEAAGEDFRAAWAGRYTIAWNGQLVRVSLAPTGEFVAKGTSAGCCRFPFPPARGVWEALAPHRLSLRVTEPGTKPQSKLPPLRVPTAAWGVTWRGRRFLMVEERLEDFVAGVNGGIDPWDPWWATWALAELPDGGTDAEEAPGITPPDLATLRGDLPPRLRALVLDAPVEGTIQRLVMASSGPRRPVKAIIGLTEGGRRLRRGQSLWLDDFDYFTVATEVNAHTAVVDIPFSAQCIMSIVCPMKGWLGSPVSTRRRITKLSPSPLRRLMDDIPKNDTDPANVPHHRRTRAQDL